MKKIQLKKTKPISSKLREHLFKKIEERDEQIVLAEKSLEALKRVHEYELTNVKALLINEFTRGYNTCMKTYGIKESELTIPELESERIKKQWDKHDSERKNKKE